MRMGYAAVLLWLSAGSAAAQPTAQLDCTGPFAKTADEAALVARFGRANVKTVDLDGAEGSTERGTAVFPDDPKRRIEIFWHDVERRRRPASITVRRGSQWVVRPRPDRPGVIALKAGLGEVEEANERPFSLMGFGWDMGGYASGWRGGKLDAMEGGCSLSLRFDPDPKANAKALARVTGERKMSSSDTALKEVRPAVSEISLGWPE